MSSQRAPVRGTYRSDPPNAEGCAFISAEDKDSPIRRDWWDIVKEFPGALKALYCKTLDCNRSTVTQRVTKVNWPSGERWLSRKIKEAILADRIEHSLGKEHILSSPQSDLLWNSAYGVEAAARTYFDKSVKDLTFAECAMLAGLPKGPTVYSPRRNLDRALERRNFVLERMSRMVKSLKISTKPRFRSSRKSTTMPIRTRKLLGDPGASPAIRRAKIGSDALYKEGLQVYTTAASPNSGDSVPPVYVKKVLRSPRQSPGGEQCPGSPHTRAGVKNPPQLQS